MLTHLQQHVAPGFVPFRNGKTSHQPRRITMSSSQPQDVAVAASSCRWHPAEAQAVSFVQTLVPAAAAALLLISPAAAFGPVSVKLEDIKVTRVECGAGVSTVGGVTFSGASQKPACLDVSAQATNPSGKPLYNADVFGRVYDVNGEAAIDDTENIRIAYLDEIPPGTSSVSFKLFVPLEQYELGPLKLTAFKATGFPGKMLPNQGSGLIDASAQADCEITGDCDDLAAEAAIR